MQLYEQIKNCYDELKNKNFIYTVNEIKTRKVPISEYKKKFKGKGGKSCLICSHTCHPLCYIESNDKKRECTAMNKSTGKCEVCKVKWSMHENRDFYWEEYEIAVQKTDKDLKKKYVKKESEKLEKEQILEGVERDISKLKY